MKAFLNALAIAGIIVWAGVMLWFLMSIGWWTL